MSSSNNNTNKEIYIEKFEPESIEHEPIPFAQIDRNVIQNIKNPVAGFIWIYLQSMPPTWKPNKHQIMKHFGISERTYERHIAFLRESGLIKYKRERDKNGHLGSVKLIILNGREFKNLDHPAKNGGVVKKTKDPNEIKGSHHTAKKPRCGDLAAYINKQDLLTYKNTKSNKNTFSSSKVVDNFSISKVKRPYATKEERIENEKLIRKREEDAERSKKEEIHAAKRFFGEIMKCRQILGVETIPRYVF